VSLLALLQQARLSRDFDSVIEAIPYARWLGLEVREEADGLLTVLPFSEGIVGNPMLPAIHGGVTGAFLESAAIVGLLAEMDTPAVPKTISITIDFLRSGRSTDTYAAATLTRLGRRVASVRVEAWQEDRAHPIAHAAVHFLLA